MLCIQDHYVCIITCILLCITRVCVTFKGLQIHQYKIGITETVMITALINTPLHFNYYEIYHFTLLVIFQFKSVLFLQTPNQILLLM